jgi:hypothetical protein
MPSPKAIQPSTAPNGRAACCRKVATAKPARSMATRRQAVAATWANPPAPTLRKNRRPGSGRASGVARTAIPSRAREKGRPNRNRTRVAPQGPASPIMPRWKALRATWSGAAAAASTAHSMAQNPLARREPGAVFSRRAMRLLRALT